MRGRCQNDLRGDIVHHHRAAQIFCRQGAGGFNHGAVKVYSAELANAFADIIAPARTESIRAFFILCTLRIVKSCNPVCDFYRPLSALTAKKRGGGKHTTTMQVFKKHLRKKHKLPANE
jgi:hypothetical protein